MANSKLGAAIIKWLTPPKGGFEAVMALMKQAGCKPYVFKTPEEWGAGDHRAYRVLSSALGECLRDSRPAAKEAKKAAQKETPEPKDTEEQFTGNIDRELQQEYPDIIKTALTGFRTLYVSRGILHGELKAAGEGNDDKSTGERHRKLVTIDAVSRRMDILWGIFDRYKKDGSLPEESFFDEPFDPEKTGADEDRQDTESGKTEFVLPADMEELKKLRETLRVRIARLENRLEYQPEKKEETPNPMPEGPKRAGILKGIEKMKKQKEAVEYRIAELK